MPASERSVFGRPKSGIRRYNPPKVKKLGNLKRTTKKGAYKKNIKRNFQVRRAPFVETKSQDTEQVITRLGITGTESVLGLRNSLLPLELQNATALTVLPLQPYVLNSQGITDETIVGTSIYSKYLKAKVEFELPYGDDTIRHPAEVYLIHGWVTQPIGATAHTTPSDKDITFGFYHNHINDQIQQYFNDRLDKIRVIPKNTSNLKIEGYRKLRVKKNNNLGMTSQIFESGLNDVIVGSQPTINMNVSWKCNKKLQLTRGEAMISPNPIIQPTQFMYPNNSWIPFLCVYNPTFSSFTDNATGPGLSPIYPPGVEPKIKVRYNVQHYFSDS